MRALDAVTGLEIGVARVHSEMRLSALGKRPVSISVPASLRAGGELRSCGVAGGGAG